MRERTRERTRKRDKRKKERERRKREKERQREERGVLSSEAASLLADCRGRLFAGGVASRKDPGDEEDSDADSC